MTSLYIALGFLPIAAMIFITSRNKKKNAGSPAGVRKTAPVSIYDRERNLALNITQDLLKIKIPDEELLVYGVIMAMDMEDSFMTLVCYLTGAANLLFSSGSGIRGGGRSVAVGEAAVELVTDAQDFLLQCQQVKAPMPPQKEIIQFHLLTNKGKFLASDMISAIKDNTSALVSLFEKASVVIKEMKQVSNS